MRTILTLAPLLVACVDQPAPLRSCPVRSVVVSDPAIIQGAVLDEIGGAPIEGALVRLRDSFDDTVLADTGTRRDGTYRIAISTAGTVPALYRHASADGYLDGYRYASPISASAMLPLITRRDADRIARSVGIERAPGTGMLLVIVTDCDGRPVEGATVEVPDATRVIYLGSDTRFDPRLGETSVDSAALVFDVPPGQVDLRVAHNGHTFDASPLVVSHADALTTTMRMP